VEPADAFSLDCDHRDVPVDDSNLVLRAARAFAAASGWRGGARFRLAKRIPPGGGLGGGSSNAVATLRVLNEMAGHRLDDARLADLAAQLGSDCPLFMSKGPVLMHGRGEKVAPLPAAVGSRIRGRRVLVFKPAFGVATAWAYDRLAAGAPGAYLALAEAEARLEAWYGNSDLPLEALLFNSMERVVFAKFVALPTLLAQLSARFGLQGRMSGSGSACFALLADDTPEVAVTQSIRDAWGPSALVVETRVT
jgi:4-diphosphocytidyl-2-C-methyl-D-erythritol kinase